MIIDATAQVAPRRYKDRELRQWMGDLIGKASPDDLLACFLWAQEGRIGLSGYREIVAIREGIERQQATVRTQKTNNEARNGLPFAEREYDQACGNILWKLQELKWKLEDLQREVGSLFDEMRMQFGDTEFTNQWSRDSDYESPLEKIGALWDEALSAKRKAEKLPLELETALQKVRRLNDRRATFYESDKKYTLAQVDSFDHKNFEVLVAWLARRDGMKAWRTGGAGDLGADVIAQSPDGRRFVLQCKHTRGRRSVDSAAMQRLNGTARPVHKADVVVMVTSGDFSKPASDFARSQKIHMIGRETLRKWSEWGDSLYSVLGVEEPKPSAHEEAA